MSAGDRGVAGDDWRSSINNLGVHEIQLECRQSEDTVKLQIARIRSPVKWIFVFARVCSSQKRRVALCVRLQSYPAPVNTYSSCCSDGGDRGHKSRLRHMLFC